MKVTHITACRGRLFALSDTGRIFYLSLEGPLAWTAVPHPPGCGENDPRSMPLPPPLPPRVIPDPDPEPPRSVQLPTQERQIDLNALPPKLRSVLQGDTPTNLCGQCGMPMRGGSCVECAVTPAGGGNYD